MIIDAAKHNLKNLLNLPDGRVYAAGGVNGPYFDLETPVRNSAHWLITYSILSSECSDKAFSKAANALLDFLLSPHRFESNGVYLHRQKHGKDWSNGVIGQAWVIEALAIAGRFLERDDALRHAEKVSRYFPFDQSVSAWLRVDLRTKRGSIDYTLNHQLWYASALSELKDEEHDKRIVLFMDMLSAGGIKVALNGRIHHLMHSVSFKGGFLRLRYLLGDVRQEHSRRNKEVGYHLYNLHPLARLRRRFPSHSLFASQEVLGAVKYAAGTEFIDSLEQNNFAYPYNAPGFELPVVATEFGFTGNVDAVIERQISKTFMQHNGLIGFMRNTPDPLTLNARIYEYLI